MKSKLIYDYTLFDVIKENEEEKKPKQEKIPRTFFWKEDNKYSRFKNLISHYYGRNYTDEEYKKVYEMIDKINGNDITYIFANMKHNLYVYYIESEERIKFFFQCDECIIGLDYIHSHLDYKNTRDWQFPACAITWFNLDGTRKEDYLKPSKLFKTIEGKDLLRKFDYRDDVILGKWKIREFGRWLHDDGKRKIEPKEEWNFCEIKFTFEEMQAYWEKNSI